jgi:CRISPR-associated protein Cas1
MPVTLTIPLNGHTSANNYLKDQLSIPMPIRKQLWSMIISEKIRWQIQVLRNHHIDASPLEILLPNIKSGDIDNIEWQAAARYWKLLFWADFIRERREEGINAWLNYGYGIVRATIARSVIAGGLHPSIGIWHDNQHNYFNLVDDLIEPFRPLVDNMIKYLSLKNDSPLLTSEMKKEILSILTYDIPFRERKENITSLLRWYVASFRDGFSESKKFEIPQISTFLQNLQ